MDQQQRNAKAMELLKRLGEVEHISLGDLVYNIREREGEGWEGPAVVAWGSTCEEIIQLLKEEKEAQ